MTSPSRADQGRAMLADLKAQHVRLSDGYCAACDYGGAYVEWPCDLARLIGALEEAMVWAMSGQAGDPSDAILAKLARRARVTPQEPEIRCAMCGATGRIDRRDCSNKHLVCLKCWNRDDDRVVDCPACDSLLEEIR